MTKAQIFIALAIFCAIGTASAANLNHEDVFNCEGELAANESSKATLAQLFANGTDNPLEIVGYMSLSSQELVSLVKSGKLPSDLHEMILNADHSLVRNFAAAHPEFKSGAVEERAAQGSNEIQAWKDTTMNLIRHRAETSGAKTRLDENFFKQFLIEVMFLSDRVAKANTFSPRYSALLGATEMLEIKVNDADYDFEKNPDYQQTMSARRLCVIAKMLDVPCVDLDQRNSPSAKRLVELFTNLPEDAGAVLAIKASSFKKIRWSKDNFPVFTDLTFDDISGIEPNSSADFQFLARTLK